MNALAVGQTYVISEEYGKTVKLVRSALAKSELSVVGEFDTTGSLGRRLTRGPEPSMILLVDCPLVIFEAQALNRAATIFFPLHVLIWADGDRTQISALSSGELFDVRLPLGVEGPLERLQARVGMALESVKWRTAPDHHEQGGEL